VTDSKEIIDSFRDSLNIGLVILKEGNFTDAVSMAIRHSAGDVILFLDDDAVAHEEWVARYVDLFAKYKGMGDAGGLVYKALLRDGNLVKTKEFFTRLYLLNLFHIENFWPNIATTVPGLANPDSLGGNVATAYTSLPY